MLDKQSQTLVLESIRGQIANRWQQIVAELRRYGDQELPAFLDESGLELSDILRRGSHLRAETYASLAAEDAAAYGTLSANEQRLARMLLYSLWYDGGGHESIEAGLTQLRAERATRAEISSVVDISFEAARHMTIALSGSLADVPLLVHARYQREEILAALEFPRNPNSFREGVWYSADRNIDAFFITLKKSEAD